MDEESCAWVLSSSVPAGANPNGKPLPAQGFMAAIMGTLPPDTAQSWINFKPSKREGEKIASLTVHSVFLAPVRQD